MTQKDPNDRVARSVLIALYGQLKRGRDVDGLLNVALKRNPRDADALIQKADLEAGRGQYREAERDLNQALHSEPNSAVAHLTLARVYGGLGSSLRQKEELAKALGLQPELVAARLELVRWHVRQKQPKAALELLDQTPPAQQSLQSVIEARNWAEMAAGNKK